jgi:hypothetical protein
MVLRGHRLRVALRGGCPCGVAWQASSHGVVQVSSCTASHGRCLRVVLCGSVFASPGGCRRAAIVVMFRLGLVVLCEHSIRTTIGTVFIHTSYFLPTLVASLLSYVVSCDVLVMCCVALFCVVPRPSDTSIVVLGFVTRITVREELQSRLINV